MPSRSALTLTREASLSLNARLEREARDARCAHQSHFADPVRWLRDALDLLAMQWRPLERSLLFDGAGLGTAWMRGALTTLFLRHGDTSATDFASGAIDEFCRMHHASIGDDGCAAIATVLQHELARASKPTLLADDEARAMPFTIGPFPRSIDPSPLSN